MTKRQRKQPPPNWQIAGRDSKNNLYRCPIRNRNGTEQCTFIGRIDTLYSHIANGEHTFETIVQTDNDIDTNVQQNIFDEVLKFGGALQMSLNQISSQAFTEFVQNIIKLTGNYVTMHPNQVFSPSTFYPGASRNTLKSHMIEKASDIVVEKLQSLRALSKFICLTVDAGTVSKHNLLEFLVCQPLLHVKPILLKTFEFSDHSAENFFSKVEEAISEAQNYDFYVSAIVGDNVSYQKAALAHWHDSSDISKSCKSRDCRCNES